MQERLQLTIRVRASAHIYTFDNRDTHAGASIQGDNMAVAVAVPGPWVACGRLWASRTHPYRFLDQESTSRHRNDEATTYNSVGVFAMALTSLQQCLSVCIEWCVMHDWTGDRGTGWRIQRNEVNIHTNQHEQPIYTTSILTITHTYVFRFRIST